MSSSLLVALSLIGLTVAFVIFTHSRKQALTWQPVRVEEKHLLYPSSLIQEAHDWYVSSKQESDSLEALLKTCYAIACIRVVQSSCNLNEIANLSLPEALTPTKLMAKLSAQQSLLVEVIRTKMSSTQDEIFAATK